MGRALVLIAGFTVTLVLLVGASAMAGVEGSGSR
jgi:ABC-type methionine transport system permease subunit